ncbi:MAG: hypothetical protein ACQERC_10520 [Bacteroidota bacterium]
MLKVITAILAIFLLSTAVHSQCPRAFDVMEADYDNGWGDNSQSKSGPLRPGDTYEMKFIAQGGMKYRVTVVSGNEQFSRDDVEFQLVGSEVNKVKDDDGRMVYKRQEVVFYDSEKSAEDEKAVFFSKRTKRLKVRINLKGVEDSKLVQCVVVFVETKRQEKIGLN